MPDTIIIYQDSGGDQDVVGNYETITPEFYAKQGFQIGTGIRSGQAHRRFTILRFKIPFGITDRTILECKFKAIGFRQPGATICIGNVDLIRTLIALHDTDNAIIPANRTAAISVISSSLTTAQVIWDSSDQLPVAQQGIITTTDFKTALIEVLQRGGWVADNYICIYFVTAEPNPAIANELFWGETQYTVDNSYNTPETNNQFWPRLEITYEINTGPSGGGEVSIEHTLDIEQVISATKANSIIEHTLEIEQDINFTKIANRVVEHELEIEQTIHIPIIVFKIIEDALFIIQEISFTPSFVFNIEHTLDIEQEIIRNGFKDKQIVQIIDVDQDIDFEIAHNRTVEHILTIEQEIHSGTIQVSIEHSLTINQTIQYEATLQVYNPLFSDISIEQDIDYSITRASRIIEHELEIIQIIIGYIEGDECDRPDTTYSPFVDSSINFPVKPQLVQTYNLILQYPVINSVHSVTLKAPLFGNREELQVTRIQRKTIDGDLKTFVNDNWPKVRTFKYQFEGITDVILNSYNNFILLSLGLEIKLTDHENRVWKGFIVTPNLEQADLSNDECSNTLGFEFIGIELDSDDLTGHLARIKSTDTYGATVT